MWTCMEQAMALCKEDKIVGSSVLDCLQASLATYAMCLGMCMYVHVCTCTLYVAEELLIGCN